MKKAFFIAHRLPYPPNKGDKLRAYHILKHLSQKFETYLFCHLDDERDLEEVSGIDLPLAGIYFTFRPSRQRKLFCLRALPKGSLTVAYFYERKLQKDYNSLLLEKRPSLIFCSCAPAAEYVFRGPETNATLFLDFMDVDSEKWRALSRKASQPYRAIYALEAKRLRAYERKIVENFERVFLVSENEAALFAKKVLESPKISVLENGVNLDFFTPTYQSSLLKEGESVVFTGAMDYLPNAEGVLWFVENCWAKIKEIFPRARFYIVGKDPLPEIRNLPKKWPGVIVTGFVKDARDYLALADVCVAPLLVARGVQNKILEAAAMGKAVVATPQAAEGLSLRIGEEILVEEKASDFAEKIIKLLDRPDWARALGKRARLRVEKDYSWEKKLAVLDRYLAGI